MTLGIVLGLAAVACALVSLAMAVRLRARTRGWLERHDAVGWIVDDGVMIARCRCGWKSPECSWPSTAAWSLMAHLEGVRDPAHGKPQEDQAA